jgi:hypothetical protein
VEQFPLWPLVGIISVTLVFNLLSVMFPKPIARLQHRLIKTISVHAEEQTEEPALLKFIFPVEAVLILSLALAIAMNIGALLAL